MRGYGSEDSYVFGRGYGHDTIAGEGVTQSHTDFVMLGNDILPDDLELKQIGIDLLLTIKDTGDTLLINEYFQPGKEWVLNMPECNAVMRQIKFADGTEWDMADVMAMFNRATEAQNTVVALDRANGGYRDGQAFDGGGGDDLMLGRDGNDVLEGGLGRDSLYGGVGDDVLLGSDGGDALEGGGGDDLLLGGEGVDALSGGDGNDTLDAGLDGLSRGGMAGGMIGGNGNDTYVFHRGSGVTSIQDFGAVGTSDKDVLHMDVGIQVEDLDVYWSPTNLGSLDQSALVIQIKGTNDRLTISDQLFSTNLVEGRLEHVAFADGRVLTWAELTALANLPRNDGATFIGSVDSDRLEGGEGNDLVDGSGPYYVTTGAADTLLGGGGNDTIRGRGFDVIDGGAGRDVIDIADGEVDGGTGNDEIRLGNRPDRQPHQVVVRHRSGGGSDALTSDSSQGFAFVTLDLSDWSASQVQWRHEGDHLVIVVPNTNDRLTVNNYFVRPDLGFAAIRFADAVSWSAQDVLDWLTAHPIPAGQNVHGTEQADALIGTAGADTLVGDDGNDSLRGAAGDDVLMGWDGADVFVFGRGSDRDTIRDAESADKVRFEAGVALGDLFVVREGEDLLIGITGTDDLLRIVGGASLDPKQRINQFEFVDSGVTVDLIGLMSRARSSNDDLLLMAGNAPTALIGGFGADRIFGGAGADTLEGGGGHDLMQAGAGNDQLRGGIGNDTIDAGDGDDMLVGGAGQDVLSGGAGSDTYLFEIGFGQDTINAIDTASSSVDVVRFGAGIKPSDLEVNLNGASGVVIRRRGTFDELTIRGDYMSGLSGADWIDRIEFADGAVWTGRDLQRVAGVGTVHSDMLFDTPLNDAIVGGRGDDEIEGNTGNDTITAGAGDDSVRGGFGNDVIVGSLGDDDLRGDTGANDYVPGGGNDTLDGGEGRDTLEGEAGDDLLLGGADQDALNGGMGNDTLRGGEGDDLIVLSPGVDTVIFDKGDGDDKVSGLEEDPRRVGYSILSLGQGLTAESLMLRRVASYYKDFNDQLQLSFAGSEGTLSFGAAYGGPGLTLGYQRHFDEIRFADGAITTASFLLARGTLNTLTTGTGNGTLQGTGSDEVLLGGAQSDTLIGGAGADWLSGERGADRMEGGLGDDTYLVENAGDVVAEQASEGTDTVVAAINWTLGAEVESLRLIGGATTGTGNALANDLRGNALDNRLDGGQGADTMRGLFGNDTYVVDSTSDVIEEVAEGGVDTVESNIAWTLGAELEQLVLTGSASINGTGNAVANRITGNAANNRLDGKVGADTLIGGAGDDVYVVESAGDVVIELAGGGNDTIESSISLTLAAEVEKLVLTGSQGLSGTGNASNNALNGNSGANRLDGGTGVDTMTGGTGNDTYVVDNSADVIVEAASGGTDKVEASASYTLSAEVEQLQLMGSANINATGNASNNTLIGNTGNNRLDGGAGNDTMIGGEGDDTYVVSATTDVITEQGNGGTDTVESGITYTLGSNVERLVLTGSSAVNGTGNGLANRLTGNSAANTLNGGAGDDSLDGGLGKDSMVGGAGNDQYWVNQADDIVTEAANEGTDAVFSDVTYTLGNNVENLTLNGGSAINGTGNALANVLTGNNGANALSGAAGNDTLDGAGGNDTLTGGAGADGYVFGRGYGSDTIVENDATTGVKDFVSFGATIAKGDISFQKSGNALLAKVNGTSDVLTLQDWYLGSKYHVEEFRFGDGTVLTDTQAQALVSAMAAFSSSGTTSSIASTSDSSQRMPSMAVSEPHRHVSF